MEIKVTTLNLRAVERQLCVAALNETGSIIEAAALLGIDRHALRRRITKHNINWPTRPKAS